MADAYRGFSIVGTGRREPLPDGRTRLTVDAIKSVGLVDYGANRDSPVLLYKRDRKEPVVSKRDDLMKLAPTLVAKMDDMAASFADIAGTDEARSELGRMVDTLMQSFCSILCDAASDKPAMLVQSAAEFAAAVTAKSTEWFSAVTKAGAKMSAARMEKFKSAMATLESIMAEVEGMMSDTKKSADPVALEKRATDAEAQVVELTKRVAELETKVPKDDADVLKSLPEDIRKRIEKAESDAKAAIEKAQAEEDKRISGEFVKRAEDLVTKSSVPAKPEEFGLVLKRIHQGKPTEADLTELDRVLKAMGEQIRKGAVFTELGRTGDATGGAWEKIEALAKAEQAKDAKLSIHKARDIVMQREPALLKQYHAERAH